MNEDKRWTIRIIADTNDADYVMSATDISDDVLNTIRPLIDAIKAFQPYVQRALEWIAEMDKAGGSFV